MNKQKMQQRLAHVDLSIVDAALDELLATPSEAKTYRAALVQHATLLQREKLKLAPSTIDYKFHRTLWNKTGIALCYALAPGVSREGISEVILLVGALIEANALSLDLLNVYLSVEGREEAHLKFLLSSPKKISDPTLMRGILSELPLHEKTLPLMLQLVAQLPGSEESYYRELAQACLLITEAAETLDEFFDAFPELQQEAEKIYAIHNGILRIMSEVSVEAICAMLEMEGGKYARLGMLIAFVTAQGEILEFERSFREEEKATLNDVLQEFFADNSNETEILWALRAVRFCATPESAVEAVQGVLQTSARTKVLEEACIIAVRLFDTPPEETLLLLISVLLEYFRLNRLLTQQMERALCLLPKGDLAHRVCHSLIETWSKDPGEIDERKAKQLCRILKFHDRLPLLFEKTPVGDLKIPFAYAVLRAATANEEWLKKHHPEKWEALILSLLALPEQWWRNEIRGQLTDKLLSKAGTIPRVWEVLKGMPDSRWKTTLSLKLFSL